MLNVHDEMIFDSLAPVKNVETLKRAQRNMNGDKMICDSYTF